MRLKNKILLSAGLLGITSPVIAETSYQCLNCPAGTYSVAGSTGISSCKSAGSIPSSIYTKTVSASQGSCKTGTLIAGQPYRVILRGGKGGTGDSCKQGNCTPNLGAKGGFVEYEFLADKNYSYKLCAGEDALYRISNSYSVSNWYFNCNYGGVGGGGAGSWIELNDGVNNYYIVAGGGGGSAYLRQLLVTYNSSNDCAGSHDMDRFNEFYYGRGGQGGGIGSGGNSCTNASSLAEHLRGGRSIYGYASGSCSSGPGLDGRANGDNVSVHLFEGDKITKSTISVGGVAGYYSTIDDLIAPTEGKASHKSNVSSSSGKCSGTTGCAVLLSV